MGSRAATGWERFFWAVFNKSTNPMSLLDEQRVRVAVNAALCEFLQRPRAALVGGRIDEIVRPNELKSLAAEWDRFMRVGDWTGDREVIRADGVAIRAQYAGRAAEIPDSSCDGRAEERRERRRNGISACFSRHRAAIAYRNECSS